MLNIVRLPECKPSEKMRRKIFFMKGVSMNNSHQKLKWSILILLGVLLMTACNASLPAGKNTARGLDNTIKTYIDVNGNTNGLFITSTNVDNPVLLFISGGPGVPEVWLNEAYSDIYPNKIAEYFTVCYWDYYGEGLSFSSDIHPEDITMERLAKDAHLVAEYLRNTFKKEKIYLMAHSSGTNLGLYLAQTNSQDFYCYFGMGQDYGGIDSVRRYEVGYKFMKALFEADENHKALKMMNKLVEVNEAEEFIIKDPKTIGRKWENVLLQAGCATTREMKSDARDIFFKQMGCKCYTMAEKINYWKGKSLLGKSSYRSFSIDYNKTCLIPVIFLSGYYDYTTPIVLSEELLDNINAPEKYFYTFYESAHSPLWEENDAVLKVINDLVGRMSSF